MRNLLNFLVILLGLIILFSLACSKDESTSSANISKAHVAAYIYSPPHVDPYNFHPSDTITGWAEIFVDNTSDIARVRVNGSAVPFLTTSGTDQFFRNYQLPITRADTIRVEIRFTSLEGGNGLATANGPFPGVFSITSQDTSEVYHISRGSGLNFAWTASLGTDMYSASLRLSYYYRDLNRTYHNLSINLDSLMTDTTLSYSPQILFPNINEIDTILSSSAFFYNFAIKGPRKEGDMGNFSGDARGFVTALTSGGAVIISIDNARSEIGPMLPPYNVLRKYYEKILDKSR
jgi:hypothetical protein